VSENPEGPDLATWTTVDGVRLYARVLRPRRPGDVPVVMLHGLGVSSASLGPLAERLAERHPVLVVDLPGFGLSDDDRIWATAEIAGAIGRLLDLRGLAPPVIVGHSYGCVVAAMLAAAPPPRARALVMLSPAFDRRLGSALGQIVRLGLDAPMERPALVLGGVRDFLRAGPWRVLATLREAAGIPLEELVAGIGVPLLVVRGSRDLLTTARWAGELRSRAGGPARVAMIPRAAHGVGHDAPGPVAAAIERFLEIIPGTHRPRMPRDPGAPS
jgi:pimeloyl-ACP methyl ester carboxylesterase